MKNQILTFNLKQPIIATLVLFMASFSALQAQNTTVEIAKKTEVTYPGSALTTDGSIKLIDNKGTIKYLQTSNGLTTLTNTGGTNVTTTTLQLGGTLSYDTYIDVDDKVFALDGIELESGEASTDATTKSDHGTGTGYTFLVRDEATGAIKKLLLNDLGVKGGISSSIATEGQTEYTITGAEELTLFKTYVYRNGIKLIAGTDYTVATNVVTLTQPGYQVLAGDDIEVHFLN
ncbi:MAG: hypothetical protein GWP32_07550 [Bacteroidetes bacterium]|nr:hypothetical protein [Bacteroidota bacterium]